MIKRFSARFCNKPAAGTLFCFPLGSRLCHQPCFPYFVHVLACQYHTLLTRFIERSNTKCIMAPYARLKECVEGLDYTAQLTTVRTWCFTDWMGTKPGLTSECPIYNQIFNAFVKMLDTTVGAPGTSVFHEPRTFGDLDRVRSTDVITGTARLHSAGDIIF